MFILNLLSGILLLIMTGIKGLLVLMGYLLPWVCVIVTGVFLGLIVYALGSICIKPKSKSYK